MEEKQILKNKPSILLMIDDLGKGGAEMLLVGILEDLRNKYTVLLVSLSGECGFDDSYFSHVTRYSLGVKNKLDYPRAIVRLRKIIKKHDPVLIHSHLVYSTIIARLASPKKIPFLFSVHNEIGANVFNKSRVLSFLEKATIKSSQTLIAVSDAVLKDYEAAINFTGKKILLQNYVEDEFFSSGQALPSFRKGEKLKIVALGNVKDSKNYDYLVRSFIPLRDLPVTLDIYGKKDEVIYPPLQELILSHNLPVAFKGVASNIPGVFSEYHLYVMSSKHEGFGIAAIEAMACRLPLLLSDLKVLREVTYSNAIFFDLNDVNGLSEKIKEIAAGKYDLEALSHTGIDIAKNYSKQKYLQKLLNIYNQALSA